MKRFTKRIITCQQALLLRNVHEGDVMVGKRMSQQKQTGEKWKPWILVALGTSLIAALTLSARPAVLKVVGDLNENRTQRAQEFSSLKTDFHQGGRLTAYSIGSSTGLSPVGTVIAQSPLPSLS
jgi:hypothetical protein